MTKRHVQKPKHKTAPNHVERFIKKYNILFLNICLSFLFQMYAVVAWKSVQPTRIQELLRYIGKMEKRKTSLESVAIGGFF